LDADVAQLVEQRFRKGFSLKTPINNQKQQTTRIPYFPGRFDISVATPIL
jgi:hypothetical protein